MDVLISWVKALIEWVKCIPDAIYCSITSLANYLLDLLIYIPKQIFSLIVKGFAAFFSAIPVPAFINDIQSKLDAASGIAGYLFDICQLQYGLTIVILAMVMRFIIRRLPVVG